MSLEDLGNIGEFVAAVGVIISLIYLAVQIRQNTRSLRAGAFQQYRQQSAELSRLLAEPDMASVYRTGLDSPGQLTEEERTRFEAMMVFAFNSSENFFLLRKMGLLDDTLWAGGRTAYLRWLLRHDGAREWWRRNRKMMSPAFCEYLEALGREASAGDRDGSDRPGPGRAW
jgi:hypothetical protein